MRNRIRVVTNGLMGHNARVYVIDGNGEEVDISDVVRGIEMTVQVGSVNKAKLDVLVDEVDIEAEQPLDVTTLVDRARKYKAA